MTDLNDQYPLYKPQVESAQDYIDLLLSGDISMLQPLIMAAFFTWLIWLAVRDKD